MACVLLYHILLPANGLNALTPVIIDENTESVSLGSYMEILVDPAGKLTIDDVIKPEMQVRWFQRKWDVPNFGYSKSVYWTRVVLVNNSRSKNYIIDIDYPPARYIEYSLIIDNKIEKVKTAGLNFKTSHKEINYSGYGFNIELLPGKKHTIIMKFSGSNTMQFPVNLASTKYFFESKNKDVLVSGLLLGFLIVMALYNFFVFL